MKFKNRSDILRVIKRNGSYEPFNSERIELAIKKAMKSPSGVEIKGQAEAIAQEIEQWAKIQNRDITIYEIENIVHDKLAERKNYSTARAYESYKAIRAYKKQESPSDSNILGLLNSTNEELMNENSNKDAYLASTQRDLIAGEVSKDLVKRKILPPNLVQAHEEGILHVHDMDYMISPIINCCLINYKDMFDNGTVINGKMVDKPKSFQVACTVLTQIIAQVASNQSGGQSIDIKHLGEYVRISYNKHYKKALELTNNEEMARKIADKYTEDEISAGIQTIQYQINTLLTTNGQSPFVTIFMHIPDGHEYEKEIAMIVEEILKQRIKGIKNEAGVYITPAFPKLIFVLDENNIHKESKYYHILRLAIECTSKRMYPKIC